MASSNKAASIHTSIIIPAFNEEACLGECLRSLLQQKTKQSFEIIVVDNGSTDKTAAIARQYGAGLVSEPIKGVCAARQAGLVKAKGRIIVSTDADCSYPSGWLQTIQTAFDEQPDMNLLIGTYRFRTSKNNRQRSGIPNFLLGAWETLAVKLYNALGLVAYVSACNLAFRKPCFKGYDTNLTQGGDELYVVNSIKNSGRILFRRTNPVITSDRRLRQGLLRTLFIDFFTKYLLNYALTRSSRRNLFGGYSDHRPGLQTGRESNERFRAVLRPLGSLALILTAAGVCLACLTAIGFAVTQITLLVALGYLSLGCGLLAYMTFSARSQLLLAAPFRIRTRQKLAALTFDDGPNGAITLKIAGIIESYGGRASFFECGANIARQPHVTRQLTAAGHTIGNHTYSHRALTQWKPRTLLKEIADTNALIYELTGKHARFFRPPWLIKTPWLSLILKRQNLQPVSGRFISYREVFQPDGKLMAKKFMKKIRPGSIIIFHDSRETHGGDRAQTIIAVKELCHRLHKDGYKLVGLDALL